MFERTTMGQVWEDRVRLSGDATFLRYVNPSDGAESRREVSYVECHRLVQEKANALAGSGVGPGDRVVVHMQNSVDMVVSILAIISLEAVVVPTIIQYTALELAYVMGHSGACVVVTDEGRCEMVAGIARTSDHRPSVLVGNERLVEGSRSDDVASATVPQERPGDSMAMLLYTSGTTANPKGVMLSHRACLGAGYSNAAILRLRPDDVLYCVLPLFHVNAMAFQLLPCMMTGSTVVLSSGFSARAYWNVVREHGVTIGNLTNGPIRILMEAATDAADSRHRMRLMCYALPLEANELMQFRDRFGTDMSMGWGLTETLACGTRTPAYIEPRHTWQSIGMVTDGWELKVVDDAGGQVPDGHTGEALVRGPALMSGYYRDPAATAGVMDNGWFHTGDLVRIDPQGYVFFEDRKKDVIKVKGENVAAGEVERVVNSAAGVLDSAAIGIPDRILGERLVVVVVAEPEDPPTVEALSQWCSSRLANFKVPSEFVFAKDLPRTSIGKIRKSELKEAMTSAHA